MKQTEVRIGNYFHHVDKFGEKHVASVHTILDHEFNGAVISPGAVIGRNIKFLSKEPIPLTEEWLVKFGFQDDNKTNREKYSIFTAIDWLLRGETPEGNYFRVYQETDKNKYSYDIRGYELGEFQVYANQHLVITVKHVHQLQNLYFALTSEEFTIK